jgi:hypothetical protein
MNRTGVLLALGTVLVVAVAALVTTLVTGSDGPSSASTRTPSARSAPSAPSSPSASSPHSAALSTAVPVGSGSPGRAGKIQPFGNGSPSPIPPGVDGCDRNYADAKGELSVCVPSVAPGGGPVDCAFLRRVGFPPLVVVGADTRHLGGNGRPAAHGETVCAS